MFEQQGDRERIVAVTGASGAIGRAIARQLAAVPGLAVVLVCRNEDKAARCVRDISRTTGNPRGRYELRIFRDALPLRRWHNAGKGRLMS